MPRPTLVVYESSAGIPLRFTCNSEECKGKIGTFEDTDQENEYFAVIGNFGIYKRDGVYICEIDIAHRFGRGACDVYLPKKTLTVIRVD
jgi:hypothetical protein